ncbi:hypothetical protein [Ferrovibrio sp.]|uniref:hypothetical protein n=1 Tax=Ferrovibrio sp. TaxID=1917215 RepID=UPI0025C416A5|nr:hypothetical protein [Ferrovibrio sp.]MBX3454340.1 hypothetical protein [Ferrovibrio sp.]
MFGSIFGTRSYAYEIYVMVDGRWRMDKRLESEPGATKLANEQLEKNAIAQANALLNMGDFSAVRVMRTRSRDDGFGTQTEIFSKQAPVNRVKPMQVRPFRGQFPVCETVFDLTTRTACRAFGTVFREFLDKQNSTAIELLHSPQHQRKLADNSNFLRAGIYALAGAQTQQGLPSQAERSRKLEALFDKLITHTRAALGEKTLPTLESGGFDKLCEAMAARYAQPNDARFYTLFQISKQTMQMPSQGAKLDFTLRTLEEHQNHAFDGLLDELAASCMDSGTLVQDLLGHRANLSEALLALAELSAGKLVIPPAPKPDPMLEKLNALLGQNRLPLVAETLWDRVLNALSSKQLLSKNEPKKEWQLTRNLNHKLNTLAPPAFKEPIDHAGRMRMERVRDMQG